MPERCTEWEARLNQAWAATGLGPGMARWYTEVDSTMNWAAALLPECGELAGAVVGASRQFEGRGRQGRPWREAVGALYLTLLFRCQGGGDTSAWPLAAGCAVRRYLSDIGCRALLKWPNDLVTAQGLKLGGILAEQLSCNSQSFILTGIGLNLVQAPVLEFAAGAVAENGGRQVAAIEAAVSLLQEVAADWLAFRSAGLAAFRDEWLEQAYGLGRNFKLEFAGERVCGSFIGLSPEGFLQLDVAGQPRSFATGTVIRIE